MANRTKSDPTPQHETMPGPGPARLGDGGDSGVHPVEQMVDAAIDRLARQHQAATDNSQRHGLALRSGSGRLRWKGLDVSDEFRLYAERVAQGEDLPPYEGRILAEPHPKFPWEPSERRRASRRAVRLQMVLWSGAAVVVGLLSWSVATRIGSTTAAGQLGPGTPPESSATAGSVTAPSEAVLSMHGAPSAVNPAPQLAPPMTETPEALDDAVSPEPLAAAAEPTAAPQVPQLAAPPSPRPSPRSQPASVRELAPIPYPDVPPPGAIREALGALLAARAEPREFPAPSEAAEPTPPTESRPSASAPAASSAPPVVRKETERQSSASESLLVETPSF